MCCPGGALTTDPRCRGGKQCAGRSSDGPAITAKQDTLCGACVQDIEKKLAELPHLALALRTFLGGSVKLAFQSKVNATREPQCPMDPRIADMLDEVEDVIGRTEDLRIADLIRLPAEARMVWVRDRHVKKHLDGVDRALDVRRVHGKVSKVVGLDRVLHRLAAPCPDCGLPVLARWIGEDNVFCTDESCGLVLASSEYDAHVKGLLENA
jgi:hypothetical protein